VTNAPRSVLLVEDSPSDARVIEAELEQTGRGRYETTWVESPKAGGEHGADAVLLDCRTVSA